VLANEDRILARVNVIGMGEVGRRLEAALNRAGFKTHAVTRDRGWSEALADSDGLHLVCVSEESLGEVLTHLSGVPPDHIAVIQNGWIRPLISNRPDITRGLIWFTAKGDFFTVLRSSPFTGPNAPALTQGLTRGGIPAHDVSASAFKPLDAEKMAFSCVVGLPLAVHHLSLHEYLERHRSEARAVFFEAVSACARRLETEAASDVWERFLETSEPLGWMRVATARAIEYRNGAVVELARLLGIAAPANAGLLEQNLGGYATNSTLDL
jgi:ketopantoate reductase